MRFQNEIEYMRTNWIDILKEGDPYYNKNLSLTKWNYSLRPLPGMGEKTKDDGCVFQVMILMKNGEYEISFNDADVRSIIESISTCE